VLYTVSRYSTVVYTTTLQTRYNADVGIHNIRPRYTKVYYYVTNGIQSWPRTYISNYLPKSTVSQQISYEIEVHTQNALYRAYSVVAIPPRWAQPGVNSIMYPQFGRVNMVTSSKRKQ